MHRCIDASRYLGRRYAYCIFNFNSVQLALVLEDYEPPALRVQGFVSRKKGARSIVEEKKEGEKKIIIMIIKKVK